MPQIFLSLHIFKYLFHSKLLLLIIMLNIDGMQTRLFGFLTFFLLFYVGVQPINNVLVVSGRQQMDSVIHICVSFFPKLPSHITLSRTPVVLVYSCLIQLYVSLLTHLHRTQGHGHSLEYLLQSFSGLRRNICSKKILFLVFLPANSSCITLACITCFFPLLAFWFQAATDQ